MAKARGNDVEIGTIVDSERTLMFPRESRRTHLYVCGSTGTGKSKFLEHLIRQDIRGWFKSKCGMLVLDPHGALYDSVIAWLARHDATRLPIIPIDLRQDEWVVSYNAIRRRETSNSSVIIGNFVQAMAHVWGAEGTNETPLFARWAANILQTLYENDLTLLEAEYLIGHLDKQARYVLMQKLKDRASLSDWHLANELKPRDFEATVGSTANRLRRFLRNPQLRSVFGNSRVSLDLRRALDEGHIVLVSLACAGGRISEEDATLFGTLLLSDLWTAALERGKSDEVKPFYVYADELQRYVTPTIARNLEEARGFGLHVTLANQFPGQLKRAGAHGEALYESVFENAVSKAVFRLQSEENLRPLAQWLFMGTMREDEIKHTLESTKVMGYEEVERVSTTTGSATTRSRTETSGQSSAVTSGESRGENESEGFGAYENDEGELGRKHIQSGTGESRGTSESRYSGSQESLALSEGETASFSETVSKVLIPILGKEISHVQFRSLEEQLHRAMAVLFDQKNRYGVVRLAGMNAPVSIHTPTVSEAKLPPARIKAYLAKLLKKWDFALPAKEALQELLEREKGLEERFRGTVADMEPETSRRRIKP